MLLNCAFCCADIPSDPLVLPLGCLGPLDGLLILLSLPDILSEPLLELPERFMLSFKSSILLVTCQTFFPSKSFP